MSQGLFGGIVPDEVFSIRDITFHVKAMSYIDAEALLPAVMQLLGPVIAAFTQVAASAEGEGAAEATELVALAVISKQLDTVAKAIEQLPKIRDAFIAYTSIELPDTPNKLVPLKTFAQEVFIRKHALVVEYVARCVWAEYKDFLLASGLNLGKLGLGE